MSDKTSWPELVGNTKEEAEAKVKQDRPDVQTQVLKVNSPATADYREDRVRIVCNDDGTVAAAPCIG